MTQPSGSEAEDLFADNSSTGRKLAENMAVVMLGKAIAVVVGLATMAVMARHLGPEQFGQYRTALTFMSLSAVIGDLGLYMVTLKEITKPGADRKAILSAALTLRLVSSTVVLATAALLAVFLPYGPTVHIAIWLSIVLYVAYQATEFLAAVFQARLMQTPRAIGEALGGVATLAAVVLVAWFGGGTLWMVIATAVGAIVAFGWCWWRAEQLESFGLAFNLPVWKNLVVVGFPLACSEILILAVVRGDTFILSLFHSAGDVGVYGIPTKIYEILTTLSFIFGGLMMGFFSRAVAERDEELFRRRLTSAVDTMLVFGIGSMAFLFVHAEEVLNLIGGQEYERGAPALQLLSGAVAAQACIHMFRYALMARDQQGKVVRIDMMAFVTGMILYMLLIPGHSFIGAALATTLNEFIILGGLLWLSARENQQPFGFGRLAIMLAAGGVFVGCLLLFAMVGLHWFLSTCISGVLYLGILLVLKVIPLELFRNFSSKV
ncbi:MAG: flippase [Geminicoccaceae bacterium]|nr:flippase [Geminicoccaceae bacterium]